MRPNLLNLLLLTALLPVKAEPPPDRKPRPKDCPYPGFPQCTDCPAENCPATKTGGADNV
jgi:hypothetical protein